jgi:phytoene dehydrogenase-like protein
MLRPVAYDAVVVGSGPNGLAAAIALSEKCPSVLLLEGKDTIGGGLRSAEITLPGFVHDICAAVVPLALWSPFFRRWDLERYGVSWIEPDVLLAHPFEDGSALALYRSLEKTADGLGGDGKAYRDLLTPLVEHHDALLTDLLAPLHLPAHPLSLVRFGLKGLRSARGLAHGTFREERTRALFAGLAAHAMIPLDRPVTAAFGMVLAMLAHSVGWPIVQGGTQRLADALAAVFRRNGGTIITDRMICSFAELPQASHYFFDSTPRQLASLRDLDLSETYRRKLQRYRYGPGVCKMDWALKEPIPWQAAACRQAGTVHLGNSFDEIQTALRQAASGRLPDAPYMVLAQPSLFDPSRAPDGRHTAWAYCHVPHGSAQDMAGRMEAKIERYAPGFKEMILGRSVLSALDMERHNPNYVGGDINGGVQDVRQLYSRPVLSLSPYRTSLDSVFLCSSSTPPGGGVHGLCGYYAVQDVLNKVSGSEISTGSSLPRIFI